MSRESDLHEILELPHRYCDGLNRKDFDDFLSVYAADAHWQVPAAGVDIRGRDNIRDWLSRTDVFAEGGRFFSQQIGAQRVVRYTPEIANVYTHFQELSVSSHGTGSHAFMVYDDEMTRNGEKWEITDRVGHFLFTGTVALPGSATPCPPLRKFG